MIERFELFSTNITHLYKHLQRIKTISMTEFDLKGNHAMIIFELHHHEGGMTVTELAELCEEDKAAVSRSIAYLNERGFTEPLGGKKYRVPIVLTPQGRAIGERIDELAVAAVNAGTSDMTDEERCKFYQTLANIEQNLSRYLKELE
jgi:DNA-binding MarR family transcriptional regulator